MSDAVVTVVVGWDMKHIAEQAGSSEPPSLAGDRLTIYGVSQAAADAAVAAYDHESRLTESKWSAVRAERNRRLDQSDWTQLADSVLSAEAKSGWAVYRQVLRDLPQTWTEPDQVVWPGPPE